MQKESPAAGRSPTFVLVILTLVYVLNYLDRQILGILSGPIKLEFHLNNTEIGLLNGTAFGLIYATLGIPIAFLAERVNRRNVVAASLVTFSVMTILCGYAANFWQLFLARFGTGIGEAGTSPSVSAILADLYPREKRASALAFYFAGLNIGLLLGFFGGGLIGEYYGWRHAFLAAGIPGLALFVVLLLTVKEPARGQVDGIADRGDTPGLVETAGFLWRQRAFCWYALGTSMSSFGGYAGLAFIPIFLMTTHHMKLHAVGLALSILTGVFGAIGTYLGGAVSDGLGKRDMRWNMYVPIIATFCTVPVLPVLFLSNNIVWVLAALAVPSLTGAAYIGPAAALTQAIVPLRMRVRAGAILLFVLNIIGLAMAAPIVGALSDLLEPSLGPDALRWALMISIVTGLAGAFCYWRASRTLLADLARVPREG
ncbi:MAG TPA: MFS transporter [Rhizomicrobium sp.]|jgi:predicted MFS family arabinose efflux permease